MIHKNDFDPHRVFLMLFNGFFLQSDSIPVYFIWVKYLSWFYYGTECLFVNQWVGAGACYKASVSFCCLIIYM